MSWGGSTEGLPHKENMLNFSVFFRIDNFEALELINSSLSALEMLPVNRAVLTMYSTEG